MCPQPSPSTMGPRVSSSPESDICVPGEAVLGAERVALGGSDGVVPGEGRVNKKPRKKYVITKNRENWTEDEHQRFLSALKKYGREWKAIEREVVGKTAVQIRSHAQKYFQKVMKNKTGEHIPPPRPKRKGAAAFSSPSVAAPVPASRLPVPVPLTPVPCPQNAMAYALAAHAQLPQHLHLPPAHMYNLHALAMHAQGSPLLHAHHQHGAALRNHPLLLPQQKPSAKAISPRVSEPTDVSMAIAEQQRHITTLAAAEEKTANSATMIAPPKMDGAAAIPVVPSNPSMLLQSTTVASPHSTHPEVSAALPPLPPRLPPRAQRRPVQQQLKGLTQMQQRQLQQRERLQQLGGRAMRATHGIVPQPHGVAITQTAAEGSRLSNGVVPQLRGGVASTQATRIRTHPALDISNAGSAATAATAAATAAASAAVAASGEAVPSSPNFTRIYGFFAVVFDPAENITIAGALVASDLSALDWEIIKLLVRNLEVNVDSSAFRQQLTETYEQQQFTLQHQGNNEEQP